MPIEKTYYSIVNPNSILQKMGSVAGPGEKYISNNSYYKGDRFWTDSAADAGDARIGVSHRLNEVYPNDSERNSLYEKLRDKLTGPKGELLTSAVEWKGSLGMITQRVTQLSAAYSSVKKLQFKKAATILKLSGRQTKSIERNIRQKNLKFSPTSAWLEYWMGWAPLHGDIVHALETMVSVPNQSQHFSVGVTFKRSQWVERTGGEFDYTKTTVDVKGKYSAYGNFLVTNHNLVLANRLGVINPVLTAWQLVPFSFIVDWFGNVGSVLGSLTDFVGLSFSNTGYATKSEITALGQRNIITGDPKSTYDNQMYLYYQGNASGFGYHRRRSPSPLQAPRLEVKMLDKLSLTRALTSISLLTEIFLKKK